MSIDHDEFIQGYVSIALFSGYDLDTEEPLDKNFSVSDLSPDLQAHVERQCAAFIQEHEETLEAFMDATGRTSADIGGDFWYTRNGHGTGFWDRASDPIGESLAEELTAASSSYGEEHWFTNEAGKLDANEALMPELDDLGMETELDQVMSNPTIQLDSLDGMSDELTVETSSPATHEYESPRPDSL